MSMIQRYEPSRDLCQPRAAVPLRGRRGRPAVKAAELFYAIREDAWSRPGAVRCWCRRYRPAMRKLALSRRPWERAFAARMLQVFRAAAEILEEITALFEREALEVEAAGEDFGRAPEDCARGVDPDGEVFEDGEVFDLADLTVEQGELLSWAMA